MSGALTPTRPFLLGIGRQGENQSEKLERGKMPTEVNIPQTLDTLITIHSNKFEYQGVGLMYAALEKNDTFSTGYAISSPRFKLDSPAILKFKYFYRGHGGYLDVCEDSVSICMIRLQNVELIKHQMADWRDAQLILHPGVHKVSDKNLSL